MSSDVLASFGTDFNVCCTESEKRAFFCILKNVLSRVNRDNISPSTENKEEILF